MTYQHILYQVDNQILTLTLHRPERLNAWTLQMKDELIHAVERANKDDNIRVIVVTGAGKHFCAGMELVRPEGNIFGYDIPQGDTLNVEEIRDSGGEFALALYNSNKPIIAAINGAAIGVGITMTLAMDFRIAARGAKLGMVFTQRGIVPETCASWYLPRLVGMQKALEWTLTGDIFTAEDALAAGLVMSLHEKDEVLSAAYALANRLIANTSAMSVALTRKMMWRNPNFEHPMPAHDVESRLMYITNQHLDGRDGFDAFLEKRDPIFTASVADDMPDTPYWPDPTLTDN